MIGQRTLGIVKQCDKEKPACALRCGKLFRISAQKFTTALYHGRAAMGEAAH
jgi:hypothetical protein